MDSVLKSAESLEQVRWFVMRAYKSEQAVEDRLKGKGGLEYFIPKHYVLRVYHGMKSKRLVPVIPGLVFVHASHKQIIEFKKSYNRLQFVIFKRNNEMEYLIVPDKQMDSFMSVASRYEENMTYFKPEEINIGKGTWIRIHGGEFDNVEGMFVRIKGKHKLVVMVGDIIGISVEISPDFIEVIPKKQKRI